MNGSGLRQVPPTSRSVKTCRVLLCAILLLAFAASNLSTVAAEDVAPSVSEDTAGVLREEIVYPFIAANETPGTLGREYTIHFRGQNVTLRANVSAGTYYGAKLGEKAAIADPDSDPADLAPGYFRAFADDPRQEEMYRDLLNAFHILRQEHGWNDDEYLELVAVFVQELPYDNHTRIEPGIPARFPAETLVDGTGDCDDKSLLLAGLLSREGYNVSLLFFLPEHHMAVGIAGGVPGYQDSGYLYIETTHPAYVGEVPPVLLNGSLPGTATQLTSPASYPIVIRMGSGERVYGSGSETAFILGQKEIADEEVSRATGARANFTGESPAQYRALVQEYNGYARIHNLIVTGRSNRAGTFASLNKEPSVLCAQPFGPGSDLVAAHGSAWQRAGCHLVPLLSL